MQDGWSYIRDTGDFLKKVKRLGKIPEGAILLTADVVGLYPNIPHDLSLQSLRKKLSETGICKVHTEEIISMTEFVLKNNYFEFNEEVCKQISGTAIGTKFTPPYACIFMDEMETSFLKTQQLQAFIWLRYIDDIFLWIHGKEQHNLFLKDLKEFYPNLKLTYKTSQNGVDFLDLNVSLKGGAIFTDLHIKPTDGYQFLHYKSSHPSHIKKLIPYSQALRISRFFSSQNDFNAHISNLKDWFLARDYALRKLLVSKSTK